MDIGGNYHNRVKIMNKKKLIVLCLLSFVCSSLFATGINALTPQQQTEYARKSLSIETSQVTKGLFSSSATYGNGFGSGIGYGESNSSLIWDPFLGANKIPRAEFFHILGEDELEKQTLEYNKYIAKQKTLMWTFGGIGVAVSVIGLAIECIPFFTNNYSNENMKYMSMGLGIALGGCGLILIAVPFEIKSNQQQNISVDFVIKLANTYNQKLLESL
jgi:hypothetical protein